MAMMSSDPPIYHTKRDFALVAMIVVVEPITSTMLLPFVYFMVKDFGYSEKQIGTRAGLITSAFFLLQAVASPQWCSWSDKIGRRPILLLGLLGSSISMLLFGFSNGIVWAILSRGLCGLLNGNAAVSRTMVSELAERTGVDKEKAFSLFGFCLAIGWIVGPIIGGSLANPAENFGWTGTGNLWVRFPYLLPCLVNAVFCLLLFFVSYVYLKETSPLLLRPTVIQDNKCAISEVDPLLRDRAEGRSNPDVERRGSETSENSHKKPRLTKYSCLTGAALFFLDVVLFDELFSLFAASSAEEGIGLSMDSQDIAKALSFAGPVMLITLILLPWVLKRLGAFILWRSTAVVFTIVYPLFSILPNLAQHGTGALWAVLLILITLRYMSLVTGITSINILMNDIVAPNDRAMMNGLGQSVASLARAAGPAIGGTIWSWSLGNHLPPPFDYHATFILLGLTSIAQGISSFKVQK